MPGESLTCVWEAAHAMRPNADDTVMERKLLKEVTSSLATLPSVTYSETKFDDIFKDPYTKFKDYKRYVNQTLREPGVPFTILHQEIEAKCWEKCKMRYIPEIGVIDENDLYRLWQIFNRLALECVFPPVICKEEFSWFIEKIRTLLSVSWKLKQPDFCEKGVTFQQMLDALNNHFFREVSKQDVKACIGNLHRWLVEEIMKCGWLFKRTKKQANWTNWIKRWFVLTPGKLTYYDSDKEKRPESKKGEVYITTHSKIESLPPYKGMVTKLEWRFRVCNEPYLQIELAAGDDAERRAWLTALEEVVVSFKSGLTPVQNLLHERYEAVHSLLVDRYKGVEEQEADGTSKDIERRLIESEKKAKAIPLAAASSDEPPEKNKSAPRRPKQTLPQVPVDENANNKAFIAQTQEKLKALFMKIDKNGNGQIDVDEFAEFIKGMGLRMSQKEVNLVFKEIDKDTSGQISFSEFSDYFSDILMDERGEIGSNESRLRAAFLAADHDSTGTLNFKEFAEYVHEKKRSIRMSRVIQAFNEMDLNKHSEVSFQQFKEYFNQQSNSSIPIYEESETDEIGNLEKRLKEFYDKTDGEELAGYIRKRWDAFATFRRYGASGDVVMKGGHGMVKDVVPGEYSLIDLACFSDLPPLEPIHTIVQGVKWEASGVPGKSGKLVFPSDFTGEVKTDLATNENLRYYGCSFADSNQVKISLLYRHGIQDFTYENKYLPDYVMSKNGGAGLEKHDFSHLDCPLEADGGDFILAKFVSEDEIHITAFKIPVRHTLYIPGGIIHSNDYLKGTWRTMLSDEAEIDHVHLVKMVDVSGENQYEHFMFNFSG